MLRIYAFPTPNNTKVMITAEEAGLRYQLSRVDLAKGEQRSPEHLRRHPLGKTPAIEHDELTLFESNAICRYLAGLGGSELYPEALAARAQVDQWAEFLSHHAGRWVLQFYWEEVIKRHFFRQPPDEAVLAEAQTMLEQQLPVLERQLEGQTFLANNRFSIADIIGYSQFEICPQTRIDLAGYPRIRQWVDAIKARPAVQRAQAALG
ncbi:glutathione S-transferase family protein [Motiliproteus sediminis]|uniref:glutathione S-transferase family protein n=1 Tax=Motiliproteus sediminis TaxID=1468178 RepID=UPI001AF01C8C|nr:glutathione S-transferase family protein [Motiliproteus sediminis]